MDHLCDFDFDFDLDFDIEIGGSSFTNPTCSPSPILSVEDIEQLLFKDDDHQAPTGDEEGFLDDILLDSPLKSGEVVEEKENCDRDPLAKKRKRQLRNRDAAVRSRERKKMHVKDLEMKSRYYEGECRRLGSLLQWYMAENQALRFTLQTTSTSTSASMTKQESAVLLLESLLLGSLLWLMVVLPSLQMESVLGKHLPTLPPGKGPTESTTTTTTTPSVSVSVSVGKRFKASRPRMRRRFFDLCSFYLDLLII